MAISQLLVDQRLGQEIERPGANRLDRRIDRAVAGDHDDGGVRAVPAAVLEDLEAVAVAQADVGQHQVVGLPVDGGDGLGATGGRVQLIALIAEPIGHRGQHVSIVVHQKKYAAFHPVHHCARTRRSARHRARAVAKYLRHGLRWRQRAAGQSHGADTRSEARPRPNSWRIRTNSGCRRRRKLARWPKFFKVFYPHLRRVQNAFSPRLGAVFLSVCRWIGGVSSVAPGYFALASGVLLFRRR